MLNRPAAQEDKLAPKGDDAAIIDECKSFMEVSSKADNENRRNAVDALNFLAGEQWDPQAKAQRTLQARPCLTINKLPTFLHQVTNDQRMNVPSIKVHPVDDDADVDTAEVIQGMIRHIEYTSNADVAYDTAVNSAAAVGFGYFRLITQYCEEDTFDQEIAFKRIRNALTVYFDQASEEPDGSDQTKCAISAKMPRTEFKRLYPDAKASDDSILTAMGDHGDWLDTETCRVTEYYRVEMKTATLIRLSNGDTGWKDEFNAAEGAKAGVTIERERQSAKRVVRWYKLSAVDVLETAEIKCKWIPVFPVWGDEIDIDGKVQRSGLIKAAMDPAKMYNVWMTAATEEVALRPKAKYIMAEGQEEGHEEEWAAANNSASPYITYKPKALGGILAPAPQRQPLADIPSGMLAMAMHASDDIKATTGLFDSSIGARGNATSGVQERAQQHQGDVSNFHYTDNLHRTLRHAGRCILNMIPHYYDAERVVRVMGADDEVSHATINQPTPTAQLMKMQQAAAQSEGGERAKAIKTVLNDVTVGQYDVTIGAGPSYSTLRQEASDNMIELAGKDPNLMAIAGDLIIKAQDWPGAQEIAERIKKTIDPKLTAEEGDQERPMVQTPKGPIPLEQAGQMLAQMDEQMQLMGQELGDAKAGVTKARIDSETKIRIAEINAESNSEAVHVKATSSMDVAELTGAVKLLVEGMKPPPALAEAATTEGDGGEEKPDVMAEMLEMLKGMQAAPKPKPGKRRMSITAPSGQVYQGEIMDDAGPEDQPIQ